MRSRKFSPIDRENPIFEVCDDTGETIYFDVGVSDAGVLEICFGEGKVMPADEFLRAFDEAKRLALANLISN